ncbi:flavin reductase family protein [Emcibacter nanhaiensis]|uniref:Flavin reductase family protein n=1 Tax=Emcibacter nanhaiensis TaxID=1505037 RepID=A0A501PJW2_9PROT|nr:flavin reductase family protein [Emcibacter nanhaiensis]TPD60184.1 flavin reductase family protein [Emcibacter nanhaiensis]
MSEELKKGFQKALRRMAASVSIVTAGDGKERAGATVSSVVSVSFEPLSLLVCIHRSSLFHKMISAQEHFCINLLQDNQQEISDRFSRPASQADLFRQGNWCEQGGLPWLEDAQAVFFLRKAEAVEFGSHTVFIGEVEEVLSREEVAPLVYLDGGYRKVPA